MGWVTFCLAAWIHFSHKPSKVIKDFFHYISSNSIRSEYCNGSNIKSHLLMSYRMLHSTHLWWNFLARWIFSVLEEKVSPWVPLDGTLFDHCENVCMWFELLFDPTITHLNRAGFHVARIIVVFFSELISRSISRLLLQRNGKKTRIICLLDIPIFCSTEAKMYSVYCTPRITKPRSF